MKLPLPLYLLIISSLTAFAQDKDTARIAGALSADQILAPLKYLASDQLRGRHIGLSEIDTAAAYIAGQFRSAGLKPVPGAKGYYQQFNRVFTPREKYHMDGQVGFDIQAGARYSLKNVLAIVPGTDLRFRSQYIILSAHYDHAGVQPYATSVDGKLDSIFNGARDNATGTAAIIAAAKYFARYPPRRSVLFICYTAEEEGEIGSNYYAQYPLIPLNHTIYNLNVDNAGYNTTNSVCLFGLGRTTSDSLIRKACIAYGLAVLPEPEGQDLFRRSDNYPLAKKGVPAPNFSLGMITWDDSIWEYYHRRNDEVGNMDLDYAVKFVRAYILSAQYIANEKSQPKWASGDEHEAEWRALYGKTP